MVLVLVLETDEIVFAKIIESFEMGKFTRFQELEVNG
jgi:hypothetical protein